MKIVPFERFALRAIPSSDETWKSMRQRLDEALSEKLQAEGMQEVPKSRHYLRDYGRPIDPGSDRDYRSLMLWCWALPLSVPAKHMERMTGESVNLLHGFYAYDDDEQKESA